MLSSNFNKISHYIGLFLCAIGILLPHDTYAQKINLNHFHRNSLYSIILKHNNEQQRYANEIEEAFKKIPLPIEYNNHNLKYISMSAPILQKVSKNEFDEAYKDCIWKMLDNNKIGGRLVAKWFNRDNKTGAFDMELVKERGLYDASISDIVLAMNSTRGKAQLEDAGEKLISHTYVLVNDIKYADDELEKNIHGAGIIFKSLIPIAGYFTVGRDMAKNINMVGYKVYVTSYLYRLEWNDDMANYFYSSLWMDKNKIIPERKTEFDTWMRQCKLKYLGCTTIYSGEMTDAGTANEEEVFVKICTRTIDRAISELQKSFDDFKVFTPLVSSAPLTAYIGVKDGVEETSQYEVLEKEQDENGKINYTRIGIIKPVKGKIWDNQYLSVEEGIEAAKFGYTTFEKVSGGDMYPGMLIREM